MRQCIVHNILGGTILLIAGLTSFFTNDALAQTEHLFPLKAGMVYHVEYPGTEGEFTLLTPPGPYDWAVVSIEKGSHRSKLRSPHFAGLNLNLAIVIEELGDPSSSTNAQAIDTIRNAITEHINELAANAYQFRIRPTSMGGGGGSYDGYIMTREQSFDKHASYMAQVTPDSITFTGMSQQKLGTIAAKLDSRGRLSGWTFAGKFK